VRRKTVLVVDDESDIRESLRDFLEEEGYAVAVASNGREALDLLRRVPLPSAIILDIIMPLMSGTELYTAIKADPVLAAIPVLFSTSDPSRAPGGTLIMKKPISLDRLLATVGTMCGGTDARR
jgi:two-component system, sensor histidine kinase and response regulator